MTRGLLVLTALLLACSGAVVVTAQRTQPEARMLDAAKTFLGSLTEAQATKASMAFNSEERLNWFYTPVPRKGVRLDELKPEQQKSGLALLRAGLSEKGYTKAETIRALETILRELEQGRGPTRHPEHYYISIFGTPSDTGTWGWRYEGHHISLNWTIVKGKSLASSPQFLGSNPAEVRAEGLMKGVRALAAEEDLARALVKSLKDEQKSEGILSPTAPADILSKNNQRQKAIDHDKGLLYTKMSKEQQGMLLAVIEEYASTQPRPVAQQRLQRLRAAGLEQVRFAWMGGLDRGQPHYYRIQGPTFLIEYDNTQNNANHAHSVWRDFNGDWGMDLLAAHYENSPHHRVVKHDHDHSHDH